MQRPCSLVLACLLALPSQLLAAASPTPPTSPTPAELARLRRGEVLVRLEPVGHGVPQEGVAVGVVDFPPERVFLAVTDLDHWDEFVPFVTRSDARPQADGSVVSAQGLDLPAPFQDRSYQIRARSRTEGEGAARVWEIAWRYIPGSGTIEDHRGSWRLARFGADRTLVTFRFFTDPGGAVPDWAMDRATRDSLAFVVEGLRLQTRRHRYSAWATGRLLPEPGGD